MNEARGGGLHTNTLKINFRTCNKKERSAPSVQYYSLPSAAPTWSMDFASWVQVDMRGVTPLALLGRHGSTRLSAKRIFRTHRPFAL